MIGPQIPVFLGVPDFNPYRLPNTAARYSIDGPASDSTYLLSSGNVQLVADRSGNSAVNALALNGVSGNYASTPNAAANQITGSFSIVVECAPISWTANKALASKYGGGSDISWYFETSPAGGLRTLTLSVSTLGSGVTRVDYTSNAEHSFLAFQTGWVRADFNSNDGGNSSVTFYTSLDGAAWTILGTKVTSAGPKAMWAGTGKFEVGSLNSGTTDQNTGVFYYAALYNGAYGGTPAQLFNPGGVGKLAASFVSSTGETWTINTSSDTGARICGARDLLQMTAAKMAAFSNSGGYNIATGDGSNDYAKSAQFSRSQPQSVYVVFKQVSWTASDIVIGGDTNDTLLLYQKTGSPTLATYAGTVAVSDNAGLPVGTRGVARCIFNAAASSLGINMSAAVTADIGGVASNGFTLFSREDGSQCLNGEFCEVIVRSVADDAVTQLKIAAFLMKKWGIAA